MQDCFEFETLNYRVQKFSKNLTLSPEEKRITIRPNGATAPLRQASDLSPRSLVCGRAIDRPRRERARSSRRARARELDQRRIRRFFSYPPKLGKEGRQETECVIVGQRITCLKTTSV